MTSGFVLSNEEWSDLRHISDLSLHHEILMHDFSSFEKEYEAHTIGSAVLINANYVLMQIHDIDAAKAERILWDEIIDRTAVL